MVRSHTPLPLKQAPQVLAQPERQHRSNSRNHGPAEHIRLPVAVDRIALPYLPIIALAHVHHLRRAIKVRITDLLHCYLWREHQALHFPHIQLLIT